LSFDEISETGSQDPRNSRTKKEIDTWRTYAEALRLDDRQTLRDMFSSASTSYAEAINNAERGYDTESLLMSIVLDQQKTINWLSARIRKLQEQLDSKS
jgi:hypothetical protein